MKHLVTLAVLAGAALALAPAPSSAGTFGLFYCHWHCNKGACCVRPYNAFTPVIQGDHLVGQAPPKHDFFKPWRFGFVRKDCDGPSAFGDDCGCVPFCGEPVCGK